MKKFLKVTLVMLVMIVMTGCGKTYEKLTYTDFQEYFNKKQGYTIQDKSDEYEISIRRYLESGNGDVRVIYVEYAKEEDAIKYLTKSYADVKGYKIKLEDDYSYVKCTKNGYQKIYRVGNIIIDVLTLDKKYKKDVNNILKDLGY